MNPILLELPQEPVERRRWLERQLVGLDLGDLVVELAAIQRSGPTEAATAVTPSTLAEACGGQLDTVLQAGLSVLSDPQLASLMRHPRLLCQLQDAILEHGGVYWEAVPRSAELEQRVSAQWSTIELSLDPQVRASYTNGSNSRESSSGLGGPGDGTIPRSVRSTQRPVEKWRWAVLAAAILLGVTLWTSRPATPHRGFDQPELLTANVQPPAYLESLSAAAGDWLPTQPEEPAALAARLREIIHGCDTLIQAPHTQIPADRDWLVERCQTWKSKFESQLADLEAGRRSALEVRVAVVDTIHALQKTLRFRAAAATGLA